MVLTTKSCPSRLGIDPRSQLDPHPLSPLERFPVHGSGDDVELLLEQLKTGVTDTVLLSEGSCDMDGDREKTLFGELFGLVSGLPLVLGSVG